MIAIDWGSSSFRAYRLDGHGTVLEQRSARAGVLQCHGEFDSVLARQIEGWDDTTILMAGMVGSRSGWQEVPYLPCPAGPNEIAAGMRKVSSPRLPQRRMFIVPGLSHQVPGRHPEVMRGEEAKLLDVMSQLGDGRAHTVCLPGTHSKWVRVAQGRIVSMRTAMTGELYALLRGQSVLAALMPEPGDDIDDADAFGRGVADSRRDGGLANHLFAVRTRGLFQSLAPQQAPSSLSGLLIGHELLGLLPAERPDIHLVGEAALLARYQRALAAFGVASTAHASGSSARGLFRLAAVLG